MAGKQGRDARGVDQHVVVALVVASPAAVLLAEEDRHLAHEPVRRRHVELRDDRPVLGRSTEPGRRAARRSVLEIRSSTSGASTPSGRNAAAIATRARSSAASSARYL